MSELDDKWMASDYLDMGQWGVLTQTDGYIVLGWSVGLSKEQCERISEYHNKRVNAFLDAQEG